MPTYQNAAVVAAYSRREGTPYSVATATSAAQVRFISSPGLSFTRAEVRSGEKRTDALTNLLRLGYKSVGGTFNTELSVGGAIDQWTEALMRKAGATATAFAFASVTTVAVGTNHLSCAAGSSFVTAGVRVGDVFYMTGTDVSGNNSVNAQVLALTTQTITVVTGIFTTLAASATGTLTLLKKFTSPTTTPTDFTHSIEQYDQQLDLSEIFIGCHIVGGRFSFRPGQMAQVQWQIIGTDRTAQATSTASYFAASATLTTSLPLVADDGLIRYNGATVASFTGFDLDFQIAARPEAVIGSLVTPAVFLNDLMVTGSITALRSDFSNLTLYDAETEFEMFMLLQEPSGTPKNAWGMFFPRVKISSLSAPFGGDDGAKIESLGLQFGPKTAATGYNAGVCTISSSGT